MIYLKVSSASQEIPLGYFLSSTDGNTELTTLTIANTDIKLWKNGATSLVNKNSGGATHMSSGIYYAVLDDTDTATYGPLAVYCHPTGALPCKTDCVVLSTNIFDSFIGATSTLIVGSVTGAVGSVTGNVSGSVASVTGNVVGSVGSVAGNVSGSVASVTGNVAGSVASVTGSVGSVAGNVSGSVASVTGNVVGSVASVVGAVGSVAGNISGSVASVTGAVGSVAGNISGSVASVTGNVVGSVASVTGAVGSVAGNVSGSVNSIATTVSAAVVSMGIGVLTSTAIADELFYTSEEVSQEVWDHSSRTLSGDQSFTLIGNLSGNVNGSVGSVTGNVVGSVGSVAGNVSGSVASITGNVVGSVASVVGAVGSVAGNVSGSVASVTGNVVGSVGSVIGAVGSVAGNVSGSVASVVNGATLTQINSLVSGIRGSDNDDLKTLSDQLDGISVSGSTPQAIWEYSSRTLSGNQSFTLIGNISGNVTGSVGSVTEKTGYSLAATQTYTLIGNVSGNVNGSVGSVTGNVVGSVASVIGSVGSVAGNVSGSVASVTGNVVGSVGSVAGNVSGSVASVTGNVVGSVASVVGAVGSVAGNISGSVASVTGNVAGSVASVVGSVGSVAGNISGSVASVTGTVGSVAGNVSGSVASVFNGATLTQINSLVSGIRGTDNDSLKNISDQLDGISVSGSTPQAIWEYSSRTLSGTQTFTLIGNLSGNVNGSVGSIASTVSSNVVSMADNVITDAAIASDAEYTLEQIGGAVWDIQRSAHTSTGSFGEYVNTSGASSSLTASDVWLYSSRTLSGTQTFNLIGNISGSVASVTGNVAGSVASVTGAVGSVAGNVSGSVASVTGNVAGSTASVVGAVGSVAGNVSGSVASVTGNVVGSVASVVGAVGSVSGLTSATITTAVWANSSRTLSGNQTFTLIGNVSGNVNGSVGSVTGNIGGSVASVTGSVGSVAGNVSGSVASVTGNVGGSTASVIGAVGSVAGNVSGSVASVTGNVAGSVASVVGAVGSVAGNVSGSVASVTGNVAGSVASVVGAVGSVAGNISGSVASVTGNVVGSVGSVAGNISGSVASVTGNVVGSVASVTGNVSGSVGSVVNGATLTQINSLVSGIRGTDNDSLKNISDQLDSISVSGSSPQAIWEYASRTLTSTGIPGTVNANVVSMAAGVITSTAIADDAEFTVSELETAVWDAQRSNHLDSGTFGEYVNVQSSSGNISETFIANSVWNSLRSSYSSNGSFGEYVNTSGVSVDASTIWSYSSRTLSGNQTFNLIGNISGSVASVTAVSDKTGYSLTVTPPTSSTIATAVWANSTRSLSGDQTFTLIGNLSGNVNGSVASIVNGATLTQINSLVSGIRGTDNDSLKNISDQLDGIAVSGSTPAAIWSYASRTLSGDQTLNIIGNISGNVNGSIGSVIGNVSGSVANVINGATLTQINSLVSGIRGIDNDSLKNISDEIAGISVSGASASDIWAYSNRTLSGNQTFNLIGNVSGSVASVVNGATLTQINSLVSGIRGSDNDDLKSISDSLADISVSGSSPAAVWAYATRTLTSSGSVTIDAADVWTYPSRTLTSTGTSDATLANQEIIIQHLEDIKGNDWTDEDLVAVMDAIVSNNWGGFGV
jgi:hypothetical protein